jgi:hypothetical protein
MGQQPQYSPDGRWWWDGHQWRPVQQPTAPPGGSQRRRGKGWIIAGSVGGVVLLLLLIAIAAAVGSSSQPKTGSVTGASQPPATSKASNPAASSCAAPCANANGWIVQVSSVKYGADSGNEFERPEGGNVYVTMQVTFINHTDQEQHANPTEFVLQDASGIKHTVTFVDACPVFQPVNLTKGTQFGPKCIAFEATANKPSPLTLVWTPGIFGRDNPIKVA